MELCQYVDLCFHASSLPCLHTFWHAIPTSFYIFNVFYFLVILCMPTHAHTDPQPSTNASTPEPTTCSLGDGAVVGISITIFLVSFSVGALLAAFISYCCCVRRSRGQPHPSPLESPQPVPVYDKVVAGKLEVKENVAYGPVDTLEMKQNPSYGPVRH